jgi:hypothetical protein
MNNSIANYKKLDWFNSIIMSILYSQSSKIKLNTTIKSSNLLYNSLNNKFKFTLTDYKSILRYFDFDEKMITYMINSGYPHNLFLPVFMKRIGQSFISLDYYKNNFYIGINDTQEFVYKKDYIKFNNEIEEFATYAEIYKNIHHETPDYIFINLWIGSYETSDYAQNIDLLCNTMPRLNTLYNIKSYNVEIDGIKTLNKEIKFNGELYCLDSAIIEIDDNFVSGITIKDKLFVYDSLNYKKTLNNPYDWIKYNKKFLRTLVYVRTNTIPIKKTNKDSIKEHYNDIMSNVSNISTKQIKYYIKNLKTLSPTRIIKHHIKLLQTMLITLKTEKPKTEKPKTLAKSDYIELIKKEYPYYIYLNNYTIMQLKQIYNRVCNNIFISYDGNNSCYIDSLFVALFNTKNDLIQQIILKSPLNRYDNCPSLLTIGEEIREDLIQLYNTISSQKRNSRMMECRSLRLLLQKYYNNYKKYVNPKYDKIEWTKTQNDYMDILTFLAIIFNIPNIIKYKINNRIENRYFVDSFSIDNLMMKDVLYVKDYYPKYTSIIELDTEYYNEDTGKMLKTHTDNIEYLSAPFLFIQFNRKYINYKIDTKVIPELKLKLKENSVSLYLNSIIIHHGSQHGGHYICLYECKGIWYKFDDLASSVSLIGKFENILEDDNYTRNISGLFYF